MERSGQRSSESIFDRRILEGGAAATPLVNALPTDVRDVEPAFAFVRLVFIEHNL
jgi:hypothetical protein